jgi:tetratricopeptide (TPR) repeat protein
VDTLDVTALQPEEEQQLQAAEAELDEVGKRLQELRKPAAKLALQVELDIQIAVTRALCGEPGEAIASLDQIARSQPKTETAAIARFEIGEIYRRLGEFEKARTAYDESLREKQSTRISDQAQRRSTAIVARSQALEALRGAPETLERWEAERRRDAAAGAEAADTTGVAAEDSLGERIALEAAYEDLAREQLRVAEIDLLDLDQPLVALREFQEVMTRYPGSLQEPRAAFGIAWIYHHELRDAERARQAYGVVVRDYADSPQGREAREILDRWARSGGMPEVESPSSRP